MARKTLWKTIVISSSDSVRNLEAYWLSSKGAFDGYVWRMDDTGGGGAHLETNLPYRDLRQIFRYAGVSFPRDHVVDIMPLDERAKEW